MAGVALAVAADDGGDVLARLERDAIGVHDVAFGRGEGALPLEADPGGVAGAVAAGDVARGALDHQVVPAAALRDAGPLGGALVDATAVAGAVHRRALRAAHPERVLHLGRLAALGVGVTHGLAGAAVDHPAGAADVARAVAVGVTVQPDAVRAGHGVLLVGPPFDRQ
ncbi:hypothetical protein Pdca_34250 [Pseudonocardia autotrophica]|nr:hypothetical protein Pdca_34250 [Pseudonocardia autotrophica]